jgi:NAD(P)-dependent dehydrogenase (short-subunit alcohol dehydrogenase family)
MVTRGLAWDAETEGLIVIAIHPGWIRTDMGGPNADISPQESAAGVIQVADSSTMDENGQFFTWSGEKHPW